MSNKTINISTGRKKQKASILKWEWRFIAKCYLALAYVGIKELKKRIYCKKQSFLWSVSTQVYDAKLLLIPILWNIKHAIELVLKAHSVTFQKRYLKTHDLCDLKNDLSEVFDIKNQGEDKKFDEFACIVNKYYKLEVFNGKILNFQTTFDTDNDILRYPEKNNTNYKLNLRAFMKITEKELEELQKDIELINRCITFPAEYKHLKQHWPSFSK